MIRASRPATVPRSLASQRSWKGKDVRDALYEGFRGKCYLCERAVTRGGFEVDHRRPRAAFPEAEYVWTNLFASCRDCNGARPKRFPDGSTRQYPVAADLLDPTVDDVELRLAQRYDAMEGQIRFDAAAPDDLSGVYTAFELEQLHNGKSARAADLRDAVHRFIVRVLAEARAYERLRRDREPEDAEVVEATSRLRRLLSRDAPFTALTRSVVPDLAHLFD